MKYVEMFLILNTLPLSVDALSCALAIRRNLRGRGPSGIPAPVTFLLYAYGALRVAPLPILGRIAMLLAGVVVQALLLFIVPAVHRRLRRA